MLNCCTSGWFGGKAVQGSVLSSDCGTQDEGTKKKNVSKVLPRGRRGVRNFQG